MLPKEEQVFLVQLTHLLDELSILLKCIIYSSNEIGSDQKDEIERTAQRARALFFIRLLAGKLNEGWEMLRQSYFGMRLSRQYENLLSHEGRRGIERLKQYFGTEDNLVNRIRNKWAFHYDRKKVEGEIDRIRKDAVLSMIVSESRGNSLNAFSDTIVNYSILNSINEGAELEAMNTLYKEIILDVGGSFQDFGRAFVDAILQRIAVSVREVEVRDVPTIREVLLPFFVERTREAKA